jgi:Family of unknown function (DUF6455)
MEDGMANPTVPEEAFPRIEAVLNAVARWVKLYRVASGARNELAACPPEEVERIAKDLGISRGEVAAKGPGSADMLQKMLRALGVDPRTPALQEPGVLSDLQRLCVTCGHKAECADDIAAGTAAQNFHRYCPNAYTLETLFVETGGKKM